jgi:hypothetical protein
MLTERVDMLGGNISGDVRRFDMLRRDEGIRTNTPKEGAPRRRRAARMTPQCGRGRQRDHGAR